MTSSAHMTGSKEDLTTPWTLSYIEDVLYLEMCQTEVEVKGSTKRCKFCGAKNKRYYHEAATYAGRISAGNFESGVDNNAKEKPLFKIYPKDFTARLEGELRELRNRSPETLKNVVQRALCRIFKAKHKMIFFEYIEHEGVNWRFMGDDQ